MGFGVALDLGDLDDRLPARAQGGGLFGQRHAAIVGRREHAAIGQVGIVRDGQGPSARLLLVAGERSPKIGRVLALVRREGQHLLRALRPIAEDDVAVQIISARQGRVLIARQRNEGARIVEGFHSVDVVGPDRAGQWAEYFRVAHDGRHGAVAEGGDHLARGQTTSLRSGLHHLAPLRHLRIGDEVGLPVEYRARQAQAFGVVRHHEEVQRAFELHRLPGRTRHRFAPREAQRHVGPELPIARGEGVG